jgi:hypothetical protein
MEIFGAKRDVQLEKTTKQGALLSVLLNKYWRIEAGGGLFISALMNLWVP